MRKMTSIGFAAAALLAAVTASAGTASARVTNDRDGELPYWQDVQTVEVNREYPRAAFMSYPDSATAAACRYENSPRYLLLNGVWKFYFVDAYGDLPADITDPATDASGWHDINVPGNWEVQGFGTAIYTNHGYEFKPRNPTPPLLPEDNPVGVYRREFEVPASWDGSEIFLNIDGAKSGVYVYLNGREVGYSEDSKTSAEFAVSDYLVPGTNTLVLKIFRWSTGSYLECQDFWRISGIERDVYLWCQPREAALKDFTVISTLDDNYEDGLFSLSAVLKNTSDKATAATLRATLAGPDGAVVWSDCGSTEIEAAGTADVWLETELEDVLPWSAEHPDLYRLTMTVCADGREVETVPYHVGFRRFEIRPSGGVSPEGRPYVLFYVNGQPVKLKGVNTHEHNPLTGHYVTEDLIRKDLELMKQNNINSVRLSHYPQGRRFYELCDQYGLYVYDEANIESHGMYYNLSKGGTLGNNPEWLAAHMDRTVNMYERNKNYPCITVWSLGNEAGNGYNFYQTYLWLKDRETGGMNRPVCYERAQWEWNSDMYVPQYPDAAWLRKIGRAGSDRPVVPSEYSHAMGNSSGSLSLQWDEIYRYPNLQGGYIWDWVDQGIWQDRDGGFWAYGGDFGVNAPSDGNFLCNGIVNPDRNPHPAMAEVKHTYQNAAFRPAGYTEDPTAERTLSTGRLAFASVPSDGKAVVEVINRFYFTPLDGYDFEYELTADGRVAASGTFAVKAAPQDTVRVALDLPAMDSKGVEYFLNLYMKQRNAVAGIPAGHVLAWDQIGFPVSGLSQASATPSAGSRAAADRPSVNASARAKGPALSIDSASSDGVVRISSSSVEWVFDRSAAAVTSYKVRGVEYFADGYGLRPNFWRGPNDNDYGNGAPKRLQIWKISSNDLQVGSVSAVMDGSDAVMTVEYLLAAGNRYIAEYTVHPDGVVDAAFHFTPALMPEVENEASEATLTATYTPGQESRVGLKARPEVPRIGVRFRLPVQMHDVTWYGRGPGENYIDRSRGSMVGLYTSSAEEMYYPYVRPQENGHRSDTRWAAFYGGGNGLMVVAKATFGFNALRNPVEDFDSEEAVEHDYQWYNFTPEQIASRDTAAVRNVLRRMHHVNDIVPQDYVEVCIDMRQQGVAGYDSWGDRPEPQYRLPADRDYTWGFTLVPVRNARDAARKAILDY